MRRLPSELNEWKTSRSALSYRILRQGVAIKYRCPSGPQHQQDNAAFEVQPQGCAVMNEDKKPSEPLLPENAFSVAVSWPPRSHAPATSELWSHRLVIGSAATLRRNPRDVTVGVFHVAGFAVNTILSIDDEPGSGGLLDPLIYRRRTIPARWPGKDIVLGRLLQGDVGDLQVHRLVLFVIGVGQEHR